MSVSIVLIVSLCAQFSGASIQSKMSELQAKNPGAKVSVRLDKKCRAGGGK